MHFHDIFYSTFIKNLKRIINDFEFDFEFVNKRIRLSSNQLSIFLYSIQNEHFEQFNFFCNFSNWRKRFKSSFFNFFDNYYSFIIEQFTINSQLNVWFDAILYFRANFCSINFRVFSSSNCSFWFDYIEFKCSQNCEIHFDFVKHKRSTNDSNSKFKRVRLTSIAFQKMSRQKSQYIKNFVFQFNFSNKKTFDILNVAYINTFYDHDIIMNFSKKKYVKNFWKIYVFEKTNIAKKNFITIKWSNCFRDHERNKKFCV